MNPKKYARRCAVAALVELLAFAAPSLMASEDPAAVLPSLFATPPSVTPAAATGKASTETNASSPGAGSERMRRQIAAKILERVNALPAKPATVAAPEGSNGSDPVVMERYVINAPPIRRVEIPVPPNRFLEAVKTGKLLSFPGSAAEVVSVGQADAGGYARITLGLRFSW